MTHVSQVCTPSAARTHHLCVQLLQLFRAFQVRLVGGVGGAPHMVQPLVHQQQVTWRVVMALCSPEAVIMTSETLPHSAEPCIKALSLSTHNRSQQLQPLCHVYVCV
jgi:hypothetical protein